MGALEKLNKEKLVKGLMINESSIPLQSCKACIQAKQAHQPFPKEAKNRATIAGERIMGDVWGPAMWNQLGSGNITFHSPMMLNAMLQCYF